MKSETDIDREERPQPMDLETSERLGTTARAVGQGIVHSIKGDYTTQKGERATVPAAEVEQILRNWPGPQKNVADQMIAKYGYPNEATQTKLFWYNNDPWLRTELTSDHVVHHWPTVHTDFLTQVIKYRVPPDKFDRLDGRKAGRNSTDPATCT